MNKIIAIVTFTLWVIVLFTSHDEVLNIPLGFGIGWVVGIVLRND